MLKTKKAGCGNYAEVSDNFMLFDKAVVPSTGGKARKSKKSKKPKKNPALKPKKYGKKKGGVFMSDMATTTSNLLSNLQAPVQAPTLPTVQPTVQPTAQTKGGRKSCKNCKSDKGGGVELAPFAAALAFLATRFATDKNFKLKDMFGKKKATKTTKSKSKSMSKSKSSA